MRTLLLLILPLLFSFKHIDTLVVGDRVVPESSAVLQLESTSGAFLPPRMTTAQRNAISSPANGMLIYNTDFQSLQAYSSGVWGSVGGGGGAGLEPWVTGTLYDTDDVIFASDDKIYAANSSHTAGTFSTDLSNGLWRELSDDIDRLSSATDFAIATWSGSSGDALQVSGVTINASDDMTGVNSADIGNLALNLNTLSSTDTNGNIILDPNGTGNVQLPDLTVSQPAYVDASGNLVSQDLDLTSDVTGVLPVANGGTGSATQNFVDLTTNQSIAGQKTFTDDTTIDASGSGDALAITHSGSGDGLSVNHSGSGVAATITGTVNVTGDLSVDNLTLDGNTVSSTDTNGNIILDPNGTGNVNLPDLTISQPAYVDASGNLVSQDLSLTSDVTGILPEANGGTGLDASAVTDGQLLIGNTSDNTFDLATITGTTDQVSVTNGNGSITLSTPQDIATTSSPTFAGVTSTGDILMSGTGQIDLPVGTTAQRSGSPNSGMLRFNSETSSFEGYNGSAWGSIGGGGGGLDIFYNEDHESATDSSDYTTGLNATFDNIGTLGGALADETTNPIAGATSIKYTTSATATNSTNDWIASASITLDDKQKGNFVGFNFFYTWDGSDDLLCVIVWDDTNDAVLNDSTDCLETASNPTRYSLGVFIPTSTNAIKLGFHHTGASESSKVLVFDDLELSSNPFVYKELSEVNSVELNGTDGRAITISTESINWSGSGNGWVSGADGSNFTNGNYYEVQKNNSIVEIDGNISFTANSTNYIGLYLNGAFYKIVSAFNTTTRKKFQFTSIKGEFSAGDKLSFGSNGAGFTSSTNSNLCHLRINEHWEAEHVVTPAKVSATNLEGYSPALVGVGTTTNQEIKYKLEGDMMTIQGRWTNGTVSATEFQLPLPSGYTIASDYSFISIVGDYQRSSAADTHYVALATAGDSFLNIGYRNAGTNVLLTPQNGNAPWGTGDAITVNATFKVEEGDTNATFLAAIPLNYTQTKTLGTTSTSNQDLSDLQFNNLVVGKWYEITGEMRMFSDGGKVNTVEFRSASGGGGDLYLTQKFEGNAGGATNDTGWMSPSKKFKAVSTTLYVRHNGADTLSSGSTVDLTELNYTKETTRF